VVAFKALPGTLFSTELSLLAGESKLAKFSKLKAEKLGSIENRSLTLKLHEAEAPTSRNSDVTFWRRLNTVEIRATVSRYDRGDSIQRRELRWRKQSG
jgi:hypothetical protein